LQNRSTQIICQEFNPWETCEGRIPSKSPHKAPGLTPVFIPVNSSNATVVLTHCCSDAHVLSATLQKFPEISDANFARA